MATVSAPRESRPRPLKDFVDVSNSRFHTSLKRSPCRYFKYGENLPTRSLQESFAEASVKAAQVQQNPEDFSQLELSLDLRQVVDSRLPVLPEGDQSPPSSPCHPASENFSFANKDLSGGSELKINESHSRTIAVSATLLKTRTEKPLPPKPALRIHDTIERIAMPLNEPFSPLEPAGAMEPSRSSQRPVSSAFHVTPSLLSSGQSSNSDSTGVIECGIARVATIQAVINSERSPDTNPSGESSSPRYVANVSRTSRIPRRNSLLNNGQRSYGSPSRQSSLGNKVPRSVLHRRQATSVSREGNSTSVGAESLSFSSSAALGSETTVKQAHTKDVLEEHVTDEGTLRTSSKYGYNIRESFEARDAIMGHSNQLTQVKSPVKSRSSIVADIQSALVRELNLQLATPDAKSESKNSNKKDLAADLHFSRVDKSFQDTDQVFDDQKAKPSTPLRNVYPGFGQGNTLYKGQYPPRTSSLPSTPSSQQPPGSGSKDDIDFGFDRNKPSLPKTQQERVSSSELGKTLLPNSRLSFFQRPTAASVSSASLNAKNVSDPRRSFSRIPQSRTLASLSDVRKGVKSLGNKFSKIMPGWRKNEVEVASDELPATHGDNMHGPYRQPSRLLTTYKNSGMNDKLVEENHQSIPRSNTFFDMEPVYHHETEGTRKQKWQKGSRNVAHDAEAGQFATFDRGAGDGYDEDEYEDEDGPPHQRAVLSAPAHYIEMGEEEEPKDDFDATFENGGADAFNLVDREDTTNGPLPFARSNTGAAPDGVNQSTVSNEESRFDSLIAESDTRIRQLLTYAFSLQPSRHRNLLVESVARLEEGVMHIRRARIETVRVTQLLEEATVLLNTQLLSLAMQQSSLTGRAL